MTYPFAPVELPFIAHYLPSALLIIHLDIHLPKNWGASLVHYQVALILHFIALLEGRELRGSSLCIGIGCTYELYIGRAL